MGGNTVAYATTWANQIIPKLATGGAYASSKASWLSCVSPSTAQVYLNSLCYLYIGVNLMNRLARLRGQLTVTHLCALMCLKRIRLARNCLGLTILAHIP